jgi:hypothetical protein
MYIDIVGYSRVETLKGDAYRHLPAFVNQDAWQVEQAMLRGGGYLYTKDKQKRWGNGYEFHMMRAISALWPFYIWHKWNRMMLHEYCQNKEVGLLGPASSGKTNFMAVVALVEWWVDPEHTTCLASSTTLKALRMRVWGEISMYFRMARERRAWLPGHVIDSIPAITVEKMSENGRDLRNALIGIACIQDEKETGLGNYAGIKNRKVRLFADEGSYMSQAFIKGANNLDSNQDFKMIVAGNPNDATDALGVVCEPCADEGGWEGVQQGMKTRVWKNRRARGVTIQLVGYDSPNFGHPNDHEPYPFLIGRRKIRETEENYGKDSRDCLREACGHMPIGGNSRRVLTRPFIRQHGATEPVTWEGRITSTVGVDAAWGGVGGDRTCLCHVEFGRDINGILRLAPRPVIIVPIKNRADMTPEDQIVQFTMDYCKGQNIPPENVGFDGRATLATTFARMWSPATCPVEFGGKPSTRPLGKITNCQLRYDRFVSELWFAVHEVIANDHMRGLGEEYIHEGCLREYHEKGGKLLSVVTKTIMKELLGRSPDIFDSLVTAVEMARRRGFAMKGVSDMGRDSERLADYLEDLWKQGNRLHKEHALNYN